MNRRAVKGAGNDTGQTDQSVPSVGTVLPDHAHLTIYDVARAAGVAAVDGVASAVQAGSGELPDRRARPSGRRASSATGRGGWSVPCPNAAPGCWRRRGRHRQPGVLRDDPRRGARGPAIAASRCSMVETQESESAERAALDRLMPRWSTARSSVRPGCPTPRSARWPSASRWCC